MDCDGPAPAKLLQAVEEFNRREFFQCHETLEALWLAERSDLRLLYQGILQVAVGLHHLLRRNYRGAASLLARGIEKLERCEPRCLGIDVASLVRDARASLDRVQALREGQISEYGPDAIPTVRLKGA